MNRYSACSTIQNRITECPFCGHTIVGNADLHNHMRVFHVGRIATELIQSGMTLGDVQKASFTRYGVTVWRNLPKELVNVNRFTVVRYASREYRLTGATTTNEFIFQDVKDHSTMRITSKKLCNVLYH